MKNPSRLEFFTWGLIALLPKALAMTFGDDVHLGIPGFFVLPACLALASGRAMHSALFGRNVFIALVLVFFCVILPLSLRVEGGYVSQSIFLLLPAPFMRSKYGHDDGVAIVWVSFYFALASAIVVRRCLSISKPVSQFATVGVATAAYCGLMYLSYWIVTFLAAAGDAWPIVAIYAVALAHGVFFLALFHDFNASSSAITAPASRPSSI